MQPSEGRAIDVYGIEGRGDFPSFGIELDQYDSKAQNISGNCFRFNRMTATIPAKSSSVRYFAFNVPAGDYVYSPFNLARLTAESPVFLVPDGKIVFLGIFRYSSDAGVSIDGDLETQRESIRKSLPALASELQVAQQVTGSPPRPFLCTP
jgi:hypothetical protein